MPILKLEVNQPYVIALKYPTGKQVEGNWGPQLRWILSNGDLLYTPLELGAKIHAATRNRTPSSTACCTGQQCGRPPGHSLFALRGRL